MSLVLHKRYGGADMQTLLGVSLHVHYQLRSTYMFLYMVYIPNTQSHHLNTPPPKKNHPPPNTQQGSGKTLAFGLPIIQLLLQQRGNTNHPATPRTHATCPLRSLVLCPTRELAMQVCDHLRAIAQPNHVWVVPLVGGISPQKQQRMLKKFPEVVVATPGRLWDLMQQNQQHLTDFSQLSCLVLDEADHMLQLGHFKVWRVCGWVGNVWGWRVCMCGGCVWVEGVCGLTRLTNND